jgi:phosphate acetyltransferase
VPAVSIVALKSKTFLPPEVGGAGRSFDMNQTQSSHSGANIQLERSKREFAFGLACGEAMAQMGRTILMAKTSTATQQDTLQKHAKYERLIARAKGVEAPKTLVVHPCDETSLRGALEAAAAGLIVPILVGPAAKISTVARTHKLDLDGIEIVDAAHSDAAAEKAVELVQAGMGEVLMKGSLHTDELMRAVTNSKTGLRTARRISHVFVLDVPTYPDTLFITDAAINIFPDLDAKRDIVQNAIDLWTQTGLGTPRVAILSAVETVTSKIPSTIEAAALCKMADRGQITGGILDGPLAFDNAIDPEAVKIKGIKSEVAGRAQILVVPDLEAGNMLAKNLIFLAHADAAGIVLGARVPVILTSRADSVRARMASCAVAVLYADARRRKAAVSAV